MYTYETLVEVLCCITREVSKKCTYMYVYTEKMKFICGHLRCSTAHAVGLWTISPDSCFSFSVIKHVPTLGLVKHITKDLQQPCDLRAATLPALLLVPTN